MAAPPARLRYAVSGLGLRPDSRVLEIGGGGGVLAGLVCDTLEPGRGLYVGVDRSATATRAASERNADAVVDGRARFEARALSELADLTDPSSGAAGPFDLAVAVNVNVFWTTPATAELEALARVLAPGGWLHLVYEPPGPEQLRRVEGLVGQHLSSGGWLWETDHADGGAALLRIRGRRPEPAGTAGAVGR